MNWLCWELLVLCWLISSVSKGFQDKFSNSTERGQQVPTCNFIIWSFLFFIQFQCIFFFFLQYAHLYELFLIQYWKWAFIYSTRISKFHVCFSFNFDIFDAFFSLIWLFNGVQVWFQRISSISYGFRIKLDCSKIGAGGDPCRLVAVISWCIQHTP